MTLTTFPNTDQRSEQWFEQRRGMVTASVVGKLLTPTLKVADNDTSRGVVTALVAERITGYTEETPMTSDMWRGVEHEPIAIDKYVDHFGRAVQSVGFMVMEQDGWRLGYSPDGLVGDTGLVEVKCPRAKGNLTTILSGEVPAYHMAQLQTGLLVSGREWIDFISFHGGMPLFVKRVTPDPRWFAAIVEAVEAFEKAAEAMTNDYLSAVVGMPMTERVDTNIVELKL